ncbi:ArnT family glycosyltransferase [Nanoarchaeota archaeon]
MESGYSKRILLFLKSNILFVLVLLALNIFLASLFFNTLPFGDTSYYAHMTKVIVEQHSIYEQDFYSYFSILLSLVNIPAFLLFRNEFLAIRVTTTIIHIMIAPLFFILFRRILRPFGRILSLLVVFSPWLIYFSGLFSVSEGLTALLAMVAFYFFIRNKDLTLQDYVGFSSFAGLALLARTAYLLFVWPFCIYLLYRVYVEHLKGLPVKKWAGYSGGAAVKKIASLFLVVIPFGVWKVISSSMLPESATRATNYFSFFIEIMTEYSSQIFNISFLIKCFLIVVFVVLPLLFGPYLIYALFRRPRFRLNRIYVVFGTFIFLVLFHTVWYVGNTLDPLMRLRYFVPYFTIGLVAITLKVKGDFLKGSKKQAFGISSIAGIRNCLKKRQLMGCLIVPVLLLTLIFFILLAAVVNFPYLSDSIVAIYPDGYETITVQSKNAFSAVEWMNQNLPEGADVGVFLMNRYQLIGMYYFLPDILRDDLEVHVPEATLPFWKHGVIEPEEDMSGLYIISRGDLSEYDAWLGDEDLKEVYSSKRPPYYFVYRVLG